MTSKPLFNISLFAAFVMITLYIVHRVSTGNRTTSNYYTAGGQFTVSAQTSGGSIAR